MPVRMPLPPLPFLPKSRLSLATAAFLLAFAISGCESGNPPDQLARAVATGEKPVAMTGSASFFDGTLGVTATVSRGIGKGLDGDQGGHGSKGNAKASGRNGQQNATIKDLSDMESEDAMAYARAKMAVGSPLPPVTLHLRLTGNGPAPLGVEVIDFISDLGNFAVQPSTLTVPPGQTVEPEPMVSQLGVGSDDIPVTVTLRVAGRRETQVVHVRPIVAAPAAGGAR